MPERIASDGGTLLALKPTTGDQSGGSPEPGAVLLYYENGVGFRYKLFGQDAAALGGGASSPLTTKGDLWGFSTVDARVPVGTDAQALFADSSNARGVAYAAITEAKLSLSDVTTQNVSITKHGFVPKAPNDATKFLDGTGAWTVPAGGGTDATAWHNTGDAFGSAKSIGTTDTFAFSIKANAVPLAKFTADALPNILLGTLLTAPGVGADPLLQYKRNDAWAHIRLECTQDGSGGQTTGEAAMDWVNNALHGITINSVGDAFAGTSYGVNTADQGRFRCTNANLIFGTVSNADILVITNDVVHFKLTKDGRLNIGAVTASGNEFFKMSGEANFSDAVHIKQTGYYGLGVDPTVSMQLRLDITGGTNRVAIDNRHATGQPIVAIGNDPLGTGNRIYMSYYNGDNNARLVQDGAGTFTFGCTSNQKLSCIANNAEKFAIDGTGIGLYGGATAGQATGGQNVTNNVTDDGSTAGTIPDFTNGTVYATDYQNIRRAIFQLARMLKQDHDWLRSISALT